MSYTLSGCFTAANVTRQERYARALIGEPLGDRLADAHRSACDHYDFSSHIHVRHYSIIMRVRIFAHGLRNRLLDSVANLTAARIGVADDFVTP